MRMPVLVRIVAGFALSVAVTTGAMAQTAGGSSTSTPPAANQPAPAQARPARVRVKLEGFDLTPPPAHGANQTAAAGTRRAGANQVGGASRNIGHVTLFAPETGLAYSLHPTFQWSGSPDTKYKLSLEDLTDHSTYEVTVDGTSFTYPETAPPLVAGRTYSWTVQPEIDLMGGESESARIVIAGGPQREQIEAALAAITGIGLAADRARARVYFDKRAWYDAAEAYSILISAHPEDRELHKMRGTLYDQVTAAEKLADEDFALAK